MSDVNPEWKTAPFEMAGMMHGSPDAILAKLRKSYPEGRYEVTIGDEIEPNWWVFQIIEKP